MEELRESGQPMWREDEEEGGEGKGEGSPLATSSSSATNRDEGSSSAVTMVSEAAKNVAPYSGAEERIGFAPGK